jgi:hypothetical protein
MRNAEHVNFSSTLFDILRLSVLIHACFRCKCVAVEKREFWHLSRVYLASNSLNVYQSARFISKDGVEKNKTLTALNKLFPKF